MCKRNNKNLKERHYLLFDLTTLFTIAINFSIYKQPLAPNTFHNKPSGNSWQDEAAGTYSISRFVDVKSELEAVIENKFSVLRVFKNAFITKFVRFSNCIISDRDN